MYRYSKKSQAHLRNCVPELQELFNEVIKHYDCSILCGHRGREEQNEAFRKGFSKLEFPHSKHNLLPSTAVDVAPYPIDWKDYKRFYHFAGFVKGVATQLGIEIIFGGDWNDNNKFNDETFNDLVHFELKQSMQLVQGKEKNIII